MCDVAAGTFARGHAAFTAGLTHVSTLPSQAGIPVSPTPAAKPQASVPAPAERDHDVLGVEVDLPALPQLEDGQPEDGQAWEFAAAVLLIGLPLLLLLALVVRFLRGSWNP